MLCHLNAGEAQACAEAAAEQNRVLEDASVTARAEHESATAAAAAELEKSKAEAAAAAEAFQAQLTAAQVLHIVASSCHYAWITNTPTYAGCAGSRCHSNFGHTAAWLVVGKVILWLRVCNTLFGKA